MKYSVLLVLIVLALATCIKKENFIKDQRRLVLESANFSAGGTIPDSLSCKAGASIKMPVLTWANAPDGVKRWALIMDDVDAIPVAGHIWDHWVVYNIPDSVRRINGAEPKGSEIGWNSSNTTGYLGPCPPPGQLHHYTFRLFALKDTLNTSSPFTANQLRIAMKGKVLDSVILTGVFKQ